MKTICLRALLLSGLLLCDSLLPAASAQSLTAFERLLQGNGTDTVLGVAPVPTGYIVVGATDSTDFPVTDSSTPAGGKDLFVVKLNLNGTVQAARRFGGSGDDQATGVVVDSTGLITVSGWTTSPNFPTVNPLQAAIGGGSDCLILQLDANLVVQFATYLGGAGEDQFAGVAHQTTLDRFVFVGFTTSTGAQFPFPSPNGANADITKTTADADGLLVALARNRTMPLATFHGLSTGNDVLLAVAADPSGLFSQDSSEVAVTGYTDAPDFYKRSGDPLGSRRKLIAGLINASTGARLHSRVRSGNGDDEGHSVAYRAGKIIVGGRTTSTDFPVSANAPQTAYGGGASDALFVAFETEDFFTVYSSYLGGTSDDSVRGLAYDPAGHLHFVGTTSSTDFPVSLAAGTPARQATFGGGSTDGITGRILVSGTGFGGSGPAIATFPTLSFLGNAGSEGLLAAAYRPDGTGVAGGAAYPLVAAGGRIVSVVAPSSFSPGLQAAGPRLRPASSHQEAPGENGYVYADGAAPLPADVGVEVRHRYDNLSPTLPRTGVIELEVSIFNNGPATAAGLSASMAIPADFEILAPPELSPAGAGLAVMTGRTLTVTIPVLDANATVFAHLLVKFSAAFSASAVTLSPSVTLSSTDPVASNNSRERIFGLSFEAPYDLQALVSITKVPTQADRDGVATLSIVNHGQHIAQNARISSLYRATSFQEGLDVVSFTASRPGDSTSRSSISPGGDAIQEYVIGTAPFLRPGETAVFVCVFRERSVLSRPRQINATAYSEVELDANPANNEHLEYYVTGGPCRFQGVVVRDGNGTPVPGAFVTHIDSTGKRTIVRSDQNGYYTFDVLPGAGGLGANSGSLTLATPVLVNPPPGVTNTIDLPLAEPPPAASPPTLGLFPGPVNASGKPQTYALLSDSSYKLQESTDLKNWTTLSDGTFLLLLSPESFGAVNPLPMLYFRAIKP